MTAYTTQWNLDPKLAPKSFSEMALSSDMREQLELYFEIGFSALLFVGDLGTGKTTSSNIFAKKYKKDGGKVHYIKGSGYKGSGGSRQFEKDVVIKSQQRTVFVEQKLFIIDEAHFLPDSCMEQMNLTIQDGMPHSNWIFCVNDIEKVSEPVIDRCKSFVFPIVKQHPNTGELLYPDTFNMSEQEWKEQLKNVGECYAEKKGVSIPDTVYEKVFSEQRHLLSTRKFVEALSEKYNIWAMAQK